MKKVTCREDIISIEHLLCKASLKIMQQSRDEKFAESLSVPHLRAYQCEKTRSNFSKERERKKKRK